MDDDLRRTLSRLIKVVRGKIRGMVEKQEDMRAAVLLMSEVELE
jgi:hypothetical protein